MPTSPEPIRAEPLTSERLPDPLPAPTTSARLLITQTQSARRLARAIASDIALYHDDTVRQARAGGAIPESLAAGIEEGRALYRDRVTPENEPLFDHAIDDIVLLKRPAKQSR